MAWRRPGDKPFSEPMMVNLLTHICLTRTQCCQSYLVFKKFYTLYKKQTDQKLNKTCQSAAIADATILVPCHEVKSLQLVSWWHHHMETFSTSLALCEGNLPVTGGFPSQRPVMWSFDVLFFDLHLNKQLSKQFKHWWFETPSHSLWRHYNVVFGHL